MKVSWWDIVTFIRCVSRQNLDPAAEEYVLDFVKKDVPWESIAALAEMEGVAGFVYCNLRDSALFDFVPTTVLKRLANSYTRTQKHSLAIREEAKTLSTRLVRAGIPVMALQGLSLTSLYSDLGLRPLGDMDLMVKPDHKGRLRRLLKQAGYHMPYLYYPDVLCKGAVWVDIHTHILNLDRIHSRQYIFPADLSAMWERAAPFYDLKKGLLVLDPFDNFVALSAHALKHSYSRLIWLVDLHECLLELIGTSGGWEEVVERTHFWCQERFVIYALILVESIFGLQIPLPVKQELGINRLNVLEKHLLRLKLKGFSSAELCYVLWLCNIKGTGNRLKFVKETVFPKEEIMTQIIRDKSWSSRKSGYFKRVVETISLVSRDLYRAATF